MRAYYLFLIYFFTILVLASCSSSRQGLFSRKSPHERYQVALKDAGLSGTALYNAWMVSAEKGLKSPVSIPVPYKESGFFPAETPRSEGYAFAMQKGEKLSLSIERRPAGGRIFSELWKMEDTARKLLYAADSLENRWEFEIEETGKYLVRLQPELLHSISFTLTIETGPSLTFPVRTNDKPKTSSFWGDARDAGARKHEGIDIFAAKRTPAVAAAAGIITRVGNNSLGGNIVFMRPSGKHYNLYYAHLDTQMVKEGQDVVAGDVIGLIGNTGNARTTPPHLHFGVYTRTGAVDPFPFVNSSRANAPAVISDTSQLNTTFRTSGKTLLLSTLIPSGPSVTLEKGAYVVPIAATSSWFKVELADGTKGYLKNNVLTKNPLPQKLKPNLQVVLDRPTTDAPVRGLLKVGQTVVVHSVWQEYA